MGRIDNERLLVVRGKAKVVFTFSETPDETDLSKLQGIP